MFGETFARLDGSVHDADHRVLEKGLRKRGNQILRTAIKGSRTGDTGASGEHRRAARKEASAS